ncbi:MAG TPA: S8 family serine peptidase [Solirubrobacteraceae bacterium]|jgi:hypothetical protein
MTARLLASTVSIALLAILCASASALAAPSSSEYHALPVCREPTRGHAGCLALALAPRTAAARLRTRPLGDPRGAAVGMAATAAVCASDYPACLTPDDLNDAYFSGEKPEAPTSEPQTIALIDAFDDPNIAADLEVYDQEFDLPACTEANGCFEKLNQRGEVGHPPVAKTEAEREEAEGWALEISTDVEAAHAVCQNCHIVLVEADSSAYPNLVAAENTATGTVRASEISNSWGGSEAELNEGEIAAFDHPDTVITASAGDDGYLNWDEWESEPLQYDEPDFPASSPDVVAVGGTRLTLGASGAWDGESIWNDDRDGAREGAGGGGCSLRFAAPEWQHAISDWASVGCENRRAVADVAADADPDSGVAVYDSVPYPYEEGGKKRTAVLKWVPIGGTSLASPIVAAMFALAGGAHEVAYPAKTLYSHLGSSLLHDVTSGGNGDCDGEYVTCSGSMKPLSPFDCGADALICNAAVGYDGASGVGTPNGIGAFTLSGEGQQSGGSPESKGGGEGGTKTESKPGGGTGESGERTSGGSPSAPVLSENHGDTSAGAGSPSTPMGTPSTDSPGASGQTVRIASIALTASTSAALLRESPLAISRLAFAFTIDAAARVRVTLARRVRTAGHSRWELEPGSFTLSARRGGERFHMRGRATLAGGRYRVTLTPIGGPSRSLTFVLR